MHDTREDSSVIDVLQMQRRPRLADDVRPLDRGGAG